MKYIDLRSDSVTMPTEEMRLAMYHAELGYDVLRDDPTVIKLENMAAEITGKEDGIFVPTGTMCNQLAILAYTKRGDEVLLSAGAHIVEAEVGAAGVISSVNIHAVPTKDGILRAIDIEQGVRDIRDVHLPPTGLVCMENALGNGKVVNLEQMKAVYEKAKEYALPVHTDGARIFNAACALGTTIKEMAQYTDSLAIHLSKGLCAPIGSVMVGTKEYIELVRRYRQMLGGGMSQAGIVASAGIVALEKMTDRLYEDHEKARRMAQLLSSIPDITVDFEHLDINLLFFRIEKSKEVLDALPDYMWERGIKISAGTEEGRFRFVFHHDILLEDVEKVAQSMKEYLGNY